MPPRIRVVNTKNAKPIDEATGLTPLSGVFTLLFDRRVPWWMKLIPLSGFFYLIMPDFIPCIVDDAGVVSVSMFLFWLIARNKVPTE